jgi:hypothetical protein
MSSNGTSSNELQRHLKVEKSAELPGEFVPRALLEFLLTPRNVDDVFLYAKTGSFHFHVRASLYFFEEEVTFLPYTKIPKGFEPSEILDEDSVRFLASVSLFLQEAKSITVNLSREEFLAASARGRKILDITEVVRIFCERNEVSYSLREFLSEDLIVRKLISQGVIEEPPGLLNTRSVSKSFFLNDDI